MNETNPEIEKDLDALADLCCQSLNGNEPAIGDEATALLKSLVMSGYGSAERSLQSDLESRVKQQCRDQAMHRGGALSGITNQLQEKFVDLVRWESRQPTDKHDPQAANISSATDA